MNTTLLAVVGLIGVAVLFDFLNGFHDAANSIATVVSTRVLSPGKAVIWAAFFNFVAAFVFGTAVAKTVGSGMVDLRIVTFSVIFAALVVSCLTSAAWLRQPVPAMMRQRPADAGNEIERRRNERRDL